MKTVVSKQGVGAGQEKKKKCNLMSDVSNVMPILAGQ